MPSMRTEMEHAESYSYIENKLGLEGGRNHCSMFFTFMETYTVNYMQDIPKNIL